MQTKILTNVTVIFGDFVATYLFKKHGKKIVIGDQAESASVTTSSNSSFFLFSKLFFEKKNSVTIKCGA